MAGKKDKKVENAKSSPKKEVVDIKVGEPILKGVDEVIDEQIPEMGMTKDVNGGDFDIDKSDIAVMAVDIKEYVKNTRQPMFPWEPGIAMDNVSVSKEDAYKGSPKLGDMIAFNPLNPNDMWLVAGKFFKDNYVEAAVSERVGKSLHNTTANGAKKNVKDIVFWGNGDTFKLISKASSEAEGWMKSTKAMDVRHGVVVQVTTQQRNPDGSYAVAEAITYIPGVKIIVQKDEEGKTIGRKIIPIN